MIDQLPKTQVLNAQLILYYIEILVVHFVCTTVVVTVHIGRELGQIVQSRMCYFKWMLSTWVCLWELV